MRESGFTEERIIALLKEHRAGLPATEPCRERGIGDRTLAARGSKYGGMEVSDAQRPRTPGEQNRKLGK